MDKFDWLASNSGPRGCPMEIADGDFWFPGNRGSLAVPRAKVHSGWGQEVSVEVVGADTKPIPDSVAVLFFSYLEDKLYRGAFALPHDSIARLFTEGFRAYDDPAGRATYRRLVVGVAPGGAVAVWASGTERQVEVFFGQAEPADVDWHRAIGAPSDLDRRTYVAGELDESAKHDSLVGPMMQHVPVGRWAAYRTRYRWRPTFEGVRAPERLYRVEYVNGERENLELPIAAAEPAGRAAPRFFLFEEPQTGRKYRPQFDDEEISAAFARAGAGGQSVELVFGAVPAGGVGPQVVVRSASETVPLRNVTYVR